MGLEVILAALLPTIADGIRIAFRWWFGGVPAEPINVDERVKLLQAETDKLRVIAELDRPAGIISSWVADLRASFRYLAAAFILGTTLLAIFLTGAGVTGIPREILDTLIELAASVFAFMFGDRMYIGLRARAGQGKDRN